MKNAIVPVGSSLVVVGGDQKIVMNAGDVLRVYASQDNSCAVSYTHLTLPTTPYV